MRASLLNAEGELGPEYFASKNICPGKHGASATAEDQPKDVTCCFMVHHSVTKATNKKIAREDRQERALGADAKVGRKTPRKARVDSLYIDVGEMV